MFGIAKSVIIKSYLSTSKRARASEPLLAVSTLWPSNVSIILTASHTNGSSSTTRIRRFGEEGALMGSNCSAEDSLFNAIDQQIHLSWTSELVDCSDLAFPQEVHAQTFNAMKKCSANLPHGTRFIFQ